MRHDLWYALRRLRAEPWHSALVVAVFGVGLGAVLAVARVADAVLLRPLPYSGGARLVRVFARVPVLPNADLSFSDVGYRAQEHRNQTFEAIASYRVVGVNLSVGATPERVLSARVTGSFFDVFDLPLRRGRRFDAGAEAAGGPEVVILSDALWRRSFGADSNVVGTSVRVDGTPATVVGVADPRLSFPSADVGYWTLMDLDRTGTEPYNFGIDIVGRLRPGVTMPLATSEASRVVQEVARENPGPHTSPGDDLSGYGAVLRPLRDELAGGVSATLALLGAAVAFVLALTGVNVAALQLVRATARRGELAVRAALGADRRRLARGALLEGALLALAGGAIGLVLSEGAIVALRTLVPSSLGSSVVSGLSVSLAAMALGCLAFCTAAAALFPVLAARSADLQSTLRERAGGATRRRAFTRHALIVTQLAAACVLVYGAALAIASVREAQRVQLGFRPEGALTFRLSLPRETYPAVTDVRVAFGALVEALRGVPGVQGVALASNVPLGADFNEVLVGVEGRPFRADGTDPGGDLRVITPAYFETMGIPLVAGRVFAEGDAFLDGTPVVISRAMASRLWPRPDDALGHRIRIGPFAPWMTIVGVVGDVRNRALTLPSRPELYLPFGAPRSPVGIARSMTFVVRASGSPTRLREAAERLVRRTNPDLPLYDVRRYDEVVGASQVREVTTMRTLTGFAAIALVLAIAGSYALLMFAVVQRGRELALRQAVGASRAQLVVMIAREVGSLLLTGVVVGAFGAAGAARLLDRYLFGVSPLDVRVTAATVVAVAAAGLAAALLPAKRAVTVDPMSLLRAE